MTISAKGLLFNDNLELSSTLTGSHLLNIAPSLESPIVSGKENLNAQEKLESELLAIEAKRDDPVKVCILRAHDDVCYYLLPSLLSGKIFSKKKKV